MLSIAEQLADGIRHRNTPHIEYAFEKGVSANSAVHFQRHERFGSDYAPIIYLAIHYDLPDVVQELLRRGADAQLSIEAGLTPRAHAAWRFRWQCLDAFDMEGVRLNDHDMVMSAIINHWCDPFPMVNLEGTLFKRIDQLPYGFLLQPDVALRMLIGVLIRSSDPHQAARRLLAHSSMTGFPERIQRALLHAPSRFVLALSQWRQFLERGDSIVHLSDETISLLAEYNVNLVAPEDPSINRDTVRWLRAQQDRINACVCANKLHDQTPSVHPHHSAGRL